MPVCHDQRPEQQDFVVVAYAADDFGGLVPAQIPDHGPCCVDGRPCRIGEHSIRERSTGPCHPLVVIFCATHDRYFTLYPPGYTPYGRAPVAPVDQIGQPLAPKGDERDAWCSTLFGAAVEAAGNGPLWSREPVAGEPSLRTQKRQAARAAAWLGLDVDDRIGEVMAEHLGIGLLIHSLALTRFRAATSLRDRAAAIAAVLDAVPKDGMLLIRLLRAGQAAGVCPEAWWWGPGRGYRYPFRPRERSP